MDYALARAGGEKNREGVSSFPSHFLSMVKVSLNPQQVERRIDPTPQISSPTFSIKSHESGLAPSRNLERVRRSGGSVQDFPRSSLLFDIKIA
jgi:hypothetical protein